MRSFVLGTGRCGTTTWARACQHLTNYTVGHQSKASDWRTRLDFPDQHIEVDHRLAFFLGTIDKFYGDDPVYVHLTRNPRQTARSWSKRKAKEGVLKMWPRAMYYKPEGLDHLKAAQLMVQTVTDDIELFLKDKTKVVRATIEHPHEPFAEFWDLIGGVGDRDAAHHELNVKHNRGPR